MSEKIRQRMLGGGNAATGWQGSYFYHNALRLQIFGAEMTVAPTNAVGW